MAPLRRQARDAEARTAKLEAERARLLARLADPALHAPGRAADVTEANQRLAAVAREAHAAEMAAEAALEAAK